MSCCEKGHRGNREADDRRELPRRLHPVASARLGLLDRRHGDEKKNDARPKLQLDFHEASTALWPMFRKYHYLDCKLNKAARCHACVWQDRIVAFCGTLHSPHPRRRNLKRCTRLVVLPDFQGVGIGTALLQAVANEFVRKGFVYSIRTSQRQMIESLKRRPEWRCTSYHACVGIFGKTNRAFEKTVSSNRVTARFEYCGTAPDSTN